MPEIAKVYLVRGQTGEYDDQRDWYVAVYLDRFEAERHRDFANEYAVKEEARLQKKHGRLWSYTNVRNNPYDKDMEMADTGTEYYVNEITLRKRSPEPKKKRRKSCLASQKNER